ncbi:ParA family protein [Saccharopolyspora sp. K220]|uniref:ParA family protein n=1 Tax=Saccharopolyspora soli TaxID=2926618 RepID=UPI001F55CB5A|nr:ParA family protein [Saccharopolyspora soli]MCI2421097.1 ParA family protein [Saccharopolyspora soli]
MIDSKVSAVVDTELIKAIEEIFVHRQRRAARKVWTLVNNKGGVGKTFDTLALAYALAVYFGLNVLVVDMDPQGNSTRRAGYGLYEIENRATLTEALKMNQEGIASQIVLPCLWEDIHNGGIDILPSRLDLEARVSEAAIADAVSKITEAVTDHDPDLLRRLDPIFQKVIGSLTHPRERLRNILGNDFLDEYDIVLIDCQPSLGHLTQMSYVASDGVLLATKPDYDSVNGAARTRSVLHEIRSALGVPTLDVHGVLVTDLQIINRTITKERQHGSTRPAEISLSQLKRTFGDLVWEPFCERKSSLADNTNIGLSPVDGLNPQDRRYMNELLINWGAKLLEVSCAAA